MVVGGANTALPGGIEHGDAFEFSIVDNANNLSFTVTEVGDSSNTATVTATSNYVSTTNHIAFSDRDESLLLALDNVLVQDIPEPSTLILTALGLVSLGCVSWRRRRREMRS